MESITKEAYKIIQNVLRNKQRSDVLLDKAFPKIKSERHRAMLNHVVRGILKMHGHLDFIAESLCDKKKYEKTELKIKVLLYLGLYQMTYSDSKPDYHVINETVEIAKSLYGQTVADFVNAVLREYQRKCEQPDKDSADDSCRHDNWLVYPNKTVERLSVQYSFPIELISNWLRQWNEDEVEQLCQYFNEPAKLSIRINQMATTKDKLISYFKKRKIEVEEVGLSKNVLTTSQVSETLTDVSLNEGYFSIQDASAAMTVELLDPQEDDNVLDLFAGPGGKCTYASEIMQNTGEVVAIDKSPQKIKLVRQAIHRLQITNTITVVEDALKYAPRAPAYDKVIIDVPCSGWGVLQKKPELRWQINQDMRSLLKLQEQALNIASLFVRPRGYLLYSTCTLNRDENERQIEKFLMANTNFSLVDAADTIPGRYVYGGCLYTLPHRDGVDGAFAAKMQKIR